MDADVPFSSGETLGPGAPQSALLDFFFPGFSFFSSAVNKYLHIDLNLYIPLVLLFGGFTFLWRYFSECFSRLVESYLMSVVDIRPEDEIYNMLMAWVANQRFAQSARRFVVNTNLNSRSWFLWRWSDDEDDEDDEEYDGSPRGRKKKEKALAYTPAFGSHWFWYRGRILIFRRSQRMQSAAFLTISEREEISISCFGRNPRVLKELLHEAREEYLKRDAEKTLIYRGTTKSGTTEPTWQRCMSRTSRPFSTVILNEKVKQELIDDVTDYLNPATRRWYANRGIPYRRGYLLYGPPGTGKSSLSLALAGFFKMRIYIVSLSSVTANEENLATLFADLPRRCVVLLEDIDTAGLTHTREDGSQAGDNNDDDDNTTAARNRRNPVANNPNNPNNPNNLSGRLSLSGLLNILDGVASQEGRVLIMTTNHIEKLDKALIRPGRVDMIVKFDRADTDMTAAIFRAIYAPLEGDSVPDGAAETSNALRQLESGTDPRPAQPTPEEARKRAAEAARKKEETAARVDELARQFAAKIPAHEFSPAEIQGFLLKNKRHPERAVEGAEQWVADMRKEKKAKELKEAQEKREAEERKRKREEEEEKKKKKRDKKKKKEEESKRKAEKKHKSRKKDSKRDESEDESESSSSLSSSSSSEAESESESEREAEKRKNTKKKRSRDGAAAVAPVEERSSSASPAEAKVQPVSVPAITVDTEKANEATVEVAKATPAPDSGYGTP